MGTGQTEDEPTIDALRREIEELRASRARLASANDAERRDIERALHAGLQQDLVGLVANLEVVAGSLKGDPDTEALVEDLRREARRALTELQELAARIYPPLLQAGGLIAELRAAASRAGLPARLDVSVTGSTPPEITGTVYFCALDVFERAPSGTAVAANVRSEEEGLVFEVVAECDLGTERRAVHDRVEALGGRVTITTEGDRTIVAGSLPVAR